MRLYRLFIIMFVLFTLTGCGLKQMVQKERDRNYAITCCTNAIYIGMSQTEAIKTFGAPNNVNKSVGSWGTREQWTYIASKFDFYRNRKVTIGTLYLYFENDKLTSWQSN